MKRRTFIKVSALTFLATATNRSAFASQTRKLTNGVDVSWLPEVEKYRKNFFTRSGKPMDGIKLLKYQGVKVGRIRVWVDPIDANGSLERALKLAKRLKKEKMQICIDLHFSDTWADPGHQTIPAAWSHEDVEVLATQLRNYTKQTLKKFKDADCTPQWVQLGNEITNGMLWPLGAMNSNDETQWQNLSRLLDAAHKGMRAVTPNAKSILHLDCGGDYFRVKWWLEKAEEFNINDFDVVGLSFYPQWHGSLEDLSSVVEHITTVNKQNVLIAETAYPWTDQTFGSDVYDVSIPPLTNYPYTKTGQAKYLKDIQQLLLDQPNNRGLGVWWWEGLATKVESNNQIRWNGGMANSALVDTNRIALPSLIQLGKI